MKKSIQKTPMEASRQPATQRTLKRTPLTAFRHKSGEKSTPSRRHPFGSSPSPRTVNPETNADASFGFSGKNPDSPRRSPGFLQQSGKTPGQRLNIDRTDDPPTEEGLRPPAARFRQCKHCVRRRFARTPPGIGPASFENRAPSPERPIPNRAALRAPKKRPISPSPSRSRA